MVNFTSFVNKTSDEIKSTIQNISTDTESPSPYPPVVTEESMKTKVVYDGVVLTSIDVNSSPTDENPQRVTFSDKTVGSTTDTDAVFLCNIQEIAREGEGYGTLIDFEATVLTPSEAIAMIEEEIEEGMRKKALFCIHGFNTSASFHLVDCLFAMPKFVKTCLIPVIWPSEGRGSYFKYREDRTYSSAAGKALQSMKDPLNKLNGASIICHSMGNRVFRSLCDPDLNFDNIFMVAADVENDLFHQKYIDKGTDEKSAFRKHGLNIKGMLKDPTKGKIHVIYNESDSRMIQSTIMNIGPRLGGTGVYMEKKFMMDVVHEDLKTCIVNVNASEDGDNHKRMLYDSRSDHNYHFHVNTIKYYEENA